MVKQYHKKGIFEHMEKDFILIESGGTKTSCVIVRDGEEKTRITLPSLHPRNLPYFKLNAFDTIVNSIYYIPTIKTYFYGAGCGSEENKTSVSTFLSPYFHNLFIYPDTLAACRATLKNTPGFVAIMGTGSVLLKYDGSKIEETIGGWGPLLGDEGSGIGFGKLIVRKYLAHQLEILRPILGENRQLIQRVYAKDGLDFLGSLSKELSSIELQKEHAENINNFLQKYLVGRTNKKEVLHVVGSYGFYQGKILAQLLSLNDLKLGTCIQFPIDRLIKYHVG